MPTATLLWRPLRGRSLFEWLQHKSTLGGGSCIAYQHGEERRLLCEKCGEYEATSILAHSRDCEDGSRFSRTRNLCSACADSANPRGVALKLAARRKRLEREFAEMRSYFTQLALTGDQSELARRADVAARWLAEVSATNPDIAVPPDLVALTSRYRSPAP